MIKLLMRYDFKMAKYKLRLIYFLNITDIIFTLILIRTGRFFEVNIFMQSVIKNEILSSLLKICLPLVLIYYLIRRMKDATDKQLLAANIFINFALILYTIINMMHALWMIIYLY